MKGRTSFVVLVASAVVVVITAAALAKGPESGTITGPGIEAPIELTEVGSGDLIWELMQRTALWDGLGSSSRLPAQPAAELGPAYTLTWVNSGPPADPIEVRTIVQLIYPHAEMGPVIHTPAQLGLERWGSGVVGWYRAPEDLTETLTALGVPVSTPRAKSDPSVLDEVEVAPAENEPARSVEASRDAARSTTGVSVDDERAAVVYPWVIAILVVAGLAWVVLRRRTQQAR